ncbi:hypothetical protein [Chthonobacter rhizosphaerae]|uniref:hypothetical protein n=1 Tax=Chthonobacter rhizosphaerae TaxID=2735553 RepID=UPI0015EF2545|nr:hypothetical protein [Chthonobacter rhizosphaerae]
MTVGTDGMEAGMRFHGRGRLAALLMAALALSSCGRPTGDFGRARPSVLHDEVLPAVARTSAEYIEGRTIAGFDLTEDEKALRDRAWAFVRPPHVGDWWLDTLVEGQRVGLLPVLDPGFDPGRYHAFLRTDPYRSTDARWNKVISDIQGDALLVPPFCAVAARVRRADAERLGALGRLQVPDDRLAEEAYQRVDENSAQMAWVWRALGYRLSAYRNAIDRFEIEAPSPVVWEANRAFALLAATRCEDAPALTRLDIDAGRRSRLLDGPDPFDRPVLQK